MVRDPLAKRFTKADVGEVRTCSCTRRAQPHVCMCTCLFFISGTAGQTALKFGVWLGDKWLCILHRMGDSALTQLCVTHSFKHMYSLPLVHRPKGVLLVIYYKSHSNYYLYGWRQCMNEHIGVVTNDMASFHKNPSDCISMKQTNQPLISFSDNQSRLLFLSHSIQGE